MDYKFNYVLDNVFFERVDGAEVRQGNVNVSLTVLRTSSTFALDFWIKGMVTVVCDRCLEDLEMPIEVTNRLIVSFGKTFSEISDEEVVVSEEEGFINVAWFMYEFIALAVPMKHVHPLGACSEVMASKLNEYCVDVQKETSESTKSSPASDPRWDVLRTLLKEN